MQILILPNDVMTAMLEEFDQKIQWILLFILEHGGHEWLQTKNSFHEFCGAQLWIFIGHLSGVLHRILFLSFYVLKIFFFRSWCSFLLYHTTAMAITVPTSSVCRGHVYQMWNPVRCVIMLLRKSLYENHPALLSHFRPQAHFSLDYCDCYGNRLKTLPQIISKEFKRATLKKLKKTLQKIDNLVW